MKRSIKILVTAIFITMLPAFIVMMGAGSCEAFNETCTTWVVYPATTGTRTCRDNTTHEVVFEGEGTWINVLLHPDLNFLFK